MSRGTYGAETARGLILTAVAVHAPLFPSVRRPRRHRLRGGRIAKYSCHFPRAQGKRIPRPRNFHLATAYRHICRIVVRSDIDAVLPRAAQRDRAVRRVDLENLTALERHQPDIEGALLQAQLRHLIVQVQELHRGLRCHAHRRRADMHLDSRPFIRPQPVANRQWIVQRRRCPFLNIGGPE